MKNISYIGLWLCLGIIFGSIFNNLAICVGVGIAIGVGLDRLKSKNQNNDWKDKRN